MKWYIFKCQNCGKKFKEKIPKPDQSIDLDHIGKYTHIISTHHCKNGEYGCAILIGAENRTRKREDGADDA